MKLGLPYDLVTTYLPPVLRTYAQAFPQVDISLVCLTSPMLAQALAAGEIDLAVIEEPVGRSTGECLSIERLVWVGAPIPAPVLRVPERRATETDRNIEDS